MFDRYDIVNEAATRNACERVDELCQENVELLPQVEIGRRVLKINDRLVRG
ncbi:MAG: hypothetical protein LLG04_15230 [Parachlamydia sp.]|nr:hypothetical protein [Parachlamydia sp.]